MMVEHIHRYTEASNVLSHGARGAQDQRGIHSSKVLAKCFTSRSRGVNSRKFVSALRKRCPKIERIIDYWSPPMAKQVKGFVSCILNDDDNVYVAKVGLGGV